jgi:hypothetical protein
MGKAILEFTLNGRKNTYFRRTDLYGKPLTTTNKNSARHVKEPDIKGTIALLIKEYGKNNIADMNIIKDEA